ncbi:MAG: hypothetical protein ABI895_15310 [Deltaproteobacteria bacterium]
MSSLYRFLALTIELGHGLLMALWGLGLPLLIWHRWPRLTRAYLWFSLSFVVGSLLSHWLLGECLLTTLAQWLWESAGTQVERVPFIVRFTNAVAGIRPSTRAAVLLWQGGISIYCVALLYWWRRIERKPDRRVLRDLKPVGQALSSHDNSPPG